MRWIFWAIPLVSATIACGPERKAAWNESGQSWGAGGRQFLNALGNTIKGEPEKEEWKAVGKDFGEAGKDTGLAIGSSVRPQPSDDRRRSSSPPASPPDPAPGEPY